MKILLTGSNGMVGKNLVSVNNKHELILPNSCELNLLDLPSIRIYLNKSKPDMIIHAAGLVGGIQANITQPVKFLVENMQMGMNIITAAFETGVGSFLNLSSSCMYPRNGKNPLVEEQILTGELEPTNEGYALAKIASTRLCEYISKESPGLLYKTIIPCNLYGPFDKFGAENSHMIPAVIKKVDEAKDVGLTRIDIWGSGKARREFMYAEDLVDFIFYAVDSFDAMPQNLNVGLGEDYTINQYYQIIADVIGYGGEFKHDLTKPVGMQQKLIDSSKLAMFGWKHKTDLTSGIQKTYDYYLREYKNV